MIRKLDYSSGGRNFPVVRQIIHLPDARGRWDIEPFANGDGATIKMHTCLRSDDDGLWRCARERHVQRWWIWQILARALQAARFRILGVIGLEKTLGAGQWIQVAAAGV
jgi:hypothetical protein